jgi:hypothetical protein
LLSFVNGERREFTFENGAFVTRDAAWRTVTNEPPAYPVDPVGIQLREAPADTEYRYEYASDTDAIGRPVATGTPTASAGR